jgi:hypothetical protein
VPHDTQQIARVVMDMLPGDRLVLGNTGVEIAIVHKSGKAARLLVLAPRSVCIERESDGGAPKAALHGIGARPR